MIRKLCLFVVVGMVLVPSQAAVATQVTVNGGQVFLDTYEADSVGGGPTPADVGVWGYTGGTVVNYDAYEGEKSHEIKNATGIAGPYAGSTTTGDVVHFTAMIKLPTTFHTWWDWQFQAMNAAEIGILNLCLATGNLDTGEVYEAGRIMYYDGSGWITSNTSLTPGQWDRLDIEYVNGASTFSVQVNGGTAESMAACGVDNLAYFRYFGNADSLDEITLLDAVPEPATIALLGFGGLALLRRRRAN